MDKGGWSAYCEYMRVTYGDAVLHEDRTDEDCTMSKQALDKTKEIEQAYDDERRRHDETVDRAPQFPVDLSVRLPPTA